MASKRRKKNQTTSARYKFRIPTCKLANTGSQKEPLAINVVFFAAICLLIVKFELIKKKQCNCVFREESAEAGLLDRNEYVVSISMNQPLPDFALALTPNSKFRRALSMSHAHGLCHDQNTENRSSTMIWRYAAGWATIQRNFGRREKRPS